MARALLIAPDFTDAERTIAREVAEWIRSAGHDVVLPPPPGAEVLRSLRTALQGCDAAIALVEGVPLDARVVWLLAAAHASRRPVLALRSDARAEVPAEVAQSVADLVKVKSWRDPEVRTRVTDFLGQVRVFAGALVRDAVPKMLKDQGQEMRFRQVAETEYPAVLKRKLVETAQRLEESDFGVEQEEIADVLELLETLINLRKYDKESLRSIKEGKWRKRGGYQKGYLLEEEPVLSSR